MPRKIYLHRRISIRQLYSVLIGLLPIISFYQAPFLSFGLGTLTVGITAPVALLFLFKGKKFSFVHLMLMIWIGYMIVRAKSSLETVFLLFMVLLHVWGALNGSIDIRVMRKTLETVAVIMAFIVLFQTFLYYIFHIRTNLLIKNLLLPANQHYATRVLPGMYRPCALFLEPSHYAQYCCFGLLSVLFPLDNEVKPNMKKALWIAMGCVLTTSGMGIALCVGIFGWHVLFNRKKRGEKLLSAIVWIVLGLLAFFVLMQFSFFNTAVQRVFGEVDGYNAIWGRTLFWDSLIGTMSGKELLIGHGLIETPEKYMTGLMEIIYFYGYVGVALLALVLLSLALFGKDNFTVCCCVIYAGLMFVANKTGFLSYVFNFGLIAASAAFNRKTIEIRSSAI